MIKALIEIGKALRERYPMPLVEVPYPQTKGKKEPKVLVVDLVTEQDNFLKISQIFLIDYNPEDSFNKYFFRNPSSAQGPAPSLSFKFPPKIRALKQRLGILNLLAYKVDEDEISKAIETKVNELKESGSLGKTDPLLIVLRIDGKWPAENERLTQKFVENFLESLGQKKYRRYWKKKWICHGCGRETEVYGGIGDLLKFYTVDKFGYAPGLNPKEAWKQYALCAECIFDLERGRRALDEFLTHRFYGKEFWLLPVATENLEDILDRFRHFKEAGGKVYGTSYESLEDRLLYEASQQVGALFYHFVFFQKEQKALRILLHLEEVLPSVLGRYVNTKNEVERRFWESIEEAFPDTEKFLFNFFSSPYLRATQKKPGFTDKDFFMLVDKVFREAPVDESYLITRTISRIGSDFLETGENTGIPRQSVLETLLSLEFLLEWGVLKRKVTSSRGGQNMNYSSFQEFFEEHGDFFNHPAKKGLVLLGVLTQKFLNYQFRERGSTPFLKMLKNLRLDQKDIQKLFVGLQNKMNEYGIGHYWPKIREGVSLSLIEAGDHWPLSPEEIGFYLAVGMSLHKHPVFEETRAEATDEAASS